MLVFDFFGWFFVLFLEDLIFELWEDWWDNDLIGGVFFGWYVLFLFGGGIFFFCILDFILFWVFLLFDEDVVFFVGFNVEGVMEFGYGLIVVFIRCLVIELYRFEVFVVLCVGIWLVGEVLKIIIWNK